MEEYYELFGNCSHIVSFIVLLKLKLYFYGNVHMSAEMTCDNNHGRHMQVFKGHQVINRPVLVFNVRPSLEGT